MATGLVLLRKSPSTRLAIAALTSSVDSLLHRRHNHSHSSKPSTDLAKSTNESSGNGQNGKFSIGWLSGVYGVASRRGFHGAAGLSFRASVPASNAGYAAAADFSDEDQTRGQGGSSGGASDVGLEISKLGISEHIVSALAGKGITKLFPIQKAVLEPAMKGCDMIGRARTGTGKTLAFGIPIMDKILRFNEKHGCGKYPLAMVLAPTRELAKQVDKEFAEAAPKLESLCVYGGVPISRQMSQLDHGVDVVVGTPGRVIDLIKRGALKLSEIQFLVLDEADQMLNVGFADDVETILQHVPPKRQCMMFSATMPSWIRKLTQKYLKDPLTIDLVGDSVQKLADGISLYAIASEMFEKPQIIGPLITEHAKGGKCIVFTQTKRDADRLAYSMQRSFKCEALHGDISQNQREITLSGFRDGRFNVLVATDVAARGLDVPNVDLVSFISMNLSLFCTNWSYIMNFQALQRSLFTDLAEQDVLGRRELRFCSPGFLLRVEQATSSMTWVRTVAGLAADLEIQVLVVMVVPQLVVLVNMAPVVQDSVDLVQVDQVVGLTRAAQGTLVVMGLVVRVVLGTLVQVVLAVLAIFSQADPVVALAMINMGGNHSKLFSEFEE
ncbi:hypothetical protein RHGRI_010305 [Rhododendron griersonianum]|uniref:Uncharacterized protein n=1 Tax=Rhododendron griersonianum TaxID=479676 RepID=A0AAV6KJ42_9ERIC|nr:hypothetical protein RHGRI_010305 [Rhododendron griersonianum]